MTRPHLLLPLLCVAALLPAAAAPAPASHQASLLQGVKEITAPGAPGGLSIFGPGAFALIAGKDGKALAPVVAAAEREKGRIVAFGHNGYLAATDDAGTARLLLNAVRWTSRGSPKPVVVLHRQPKLAALLEAEGAEVRAGDAAKWSAQLQGAQVVVADAHQIREPDIAALDRFIREGGGLVTAATGWGWESLNAGKKVATDFPASALLRPAGLVWTNNTPGRTLSSGYSAPDGELTLLNAGHALNVIAAQKESSGADAAALGQAAATVSLALRTLPPDDQVLLPRLNALAASPDAVDFPRPDKPLEQQKHALARLVFTRSLQLLRQAPPQQIRAHPAAEHFPGAVPRDAARVQERTVVIDTRIPRWHSTGLYAAPGEVIGVEISEDAVAQELSVRIGCHTDSIWHLEKWERAPEISLSQGLSQQLTQVASAFGGLIYIEVKEGKPAAEVPVKIRGAVEAPHFVLGRTTNAEWREKVRQHPAPWAELETKKIILSVPSAAIRQLDDPEELMKFWDGVLDAQVDLAAILRERAWAERIVADQQISAGYMHAGYPIMTHLDAVAQSVSTDRMRSGSWGHFHELGHNHQRPEWTFDGTVEVTCNLFTLYVNETVCGLPPLTGLDAIEPRRVEERLRKHLAGGANFQRWKSDPFLALTMYGQLRQAFGWEPYKKVFAEYRDLPRDERPKNDDEKRDQWMVRFSRTIGKNLGPFFVAWGVPTSETARKSIADLPEWMPEEWPAR